MQSVLGRITLKSSHYAFVVIKIMTTAVGREREEQSCVYVAPRKDGACGDRVCNV